MGRYTLQPRQATQKLLLRFLKRGQTQHRKIQLEKQLHRLHSRKTRMVHMQPCCVPSVEHDLRCSSSKYMHKLIMMIVTSRKAVREHIEVSKGLHVFFIHKKVFITRLEDI